MDDSLPTITFGFEAWDAYLYRLQSLAGYFVLVDGFEVSLRVGEEGGPTEVLDGLWHLVGTELDDDGAELGSIAIPLESTDEDGFHWKEAVHVHVW